jgi:HlyD family secretion protein
MAVDAKRIAAGVGAVLLVAAGATYLHWAPGRALPDGLIQANGRIEGDRLTVASKFAGRIRTLGVREGDAVEAGAVLAVLDDAQADARVAQARANVLKAREQAAQAGATVSEADANVTATRAAVTQAEARAVHARQVAAATAARVDAATRGLSVLRREADVLLAQADAAVAHARATLVRAEAAEQQADRDAERYRSLVGQGLVEPQRGEQAALALTVARSDVIAATSAVTHAHQQLADAQLGAERVRAREDDVRALEAQHRAEHASVREADAGVARAHTAVVQARAALRRAGAALRQSNAAHAEAEAALAEAASIRADLTIVAPAAGVVLTRIAEVGEVVGAGAPLLDLVDLDRLYLKVFVPEPLIGKIRLGLAARIHTDAFPDHPFPATVRMIASRAEFTPKEVQTPDERVKLVYAVKLHLDANPEHRLAPGLPADAVIRWKDGVPWLPPRR